MHSQLTAALLAADKMGDKLSVSRTGKGMAERVCTGIRLNLHKEGEPHLEDTGKVKEPVPRDQGCGLHAREESQMALTGAERPVGMTRGGLARLREFCLQPATPPRAPGTCSERAQRARTRKAQGSWEAERPRTLERGEPGQGLSTRGSISHG